MRGATAAAVLLTVLALLDASAALRIDEADAERFVQSALNLTKGHGGECAVGAGCGMVAGWLIRRLQSLVLTATVLGAASAFGALHLGWINPDQLQFCAAAAGNSIRSCITRHAQVRARNRPSIPTRRASLALAAARYSRDAAVRTHVLTARSCHRG